MEEMQEIENALSQFEKALNEGKFIYDDDPYKRGWNDALKAVKMLLKTAGERSENED